MEVIWSKRVVENLRIIWKFYKKHSLIGANKIVQGIKTKGDSLSPYILHQTEENLQPNQYRAIYKYFKIIYMIKNNQVLILQIFDARQDPDKLK